MRNRLISATLFGVLLLGSNGCAWFQSQERESEWDSFDHLEPESQGDAPVFDFGRSETQLMGVSSQSQQIERRLGVR